MSAFLPLRPPHPSLPSASCHSLPLDKSYPGDGGQAQLSAFEVCKGKGTSYCISPLLGLPTPDVLFAILIFVTTTILLPLSPHLHAALCSQHLNVEILKPQC